MIIIDFKIDENELAENLDNDIPNVDYVLFVTTLFIMPVRFRINESDLFEINNDPWAEMPIINFASEGVQKIKKLLITRKEVYTLLEGVGVLQFIMEDEKNVKIIFNDSAKSIVNNVNYKELLEALQKFANKVRKFFWDRVPQINEHPYWGPWLREERD